MPVRLAGEQLMGKTHRGKRLENEEYHINYLELEAIFLAVRAYKRYWRGNRHIQIKSDNATAITYVSNMGELFQRNVTISQNKLGICAYVKISGYQLSIFLASKIQLQILCLDL